MLLIYDFNAIQFLYFDAPVVSTSVCCIQFMINLRSLTIRNWSPDFDLTPLTQLTYLRVLHSVDVIHQKEIEDLDIETVDVHYYQPSQQANLILNLNHECLLKIVEYIPLVSDCEALAQVHPRFDELVVSQKYYHLNSNTMTSEYTTIVLTMTNFMVRIAPFVKTLTLWNKNFLTGILPHTKTMKSLQMYDVDIPFMATQMPLGLEDLCIVRGDFKDLPAYLKLLSPTLRSITLYDHKGHLSNLHNIRELTVGDCIEQDLKQFIEQNQSSLERITMSAEQLPSVSCRLFGQLKKLKYLSLDGHGRYNPKTPSLIKSLLETVGSTLDGLRLDAHLTRSVEGVLDSKHLIGLRELKVCYHYDTTLMKELPSLYMLKTLERMDLCVFGPINHTDGCVLLGLVQALPLLKFLQTNCSHSHSVRCIVDLSCYLRETGRSLQLDTSKFAIHWLFKFTIIKHINPFQNYCRKFEVILMADR